MRFSAVIVSAGKGERAGGALPKQLQLLGGKPVFLWSIDRFLEHPDTDEVVLVAPAGHADAYTSVLGERSVKVAPGGPTRAASVLSGLKTLDGDGDRIVFVHDAARPGLSVPLINDLADAMGEHDGAAPALPVSDALKRREADRVITVDREALLRVQTPQVFRLGQLRAALESGGDDFVDDLQAVEAAGARIGFVTGSEMLAKITYPGDLDRMEKLLADPTPTIPRMGSGFDVHAFEAGDHVTLCGIRIPHSARLKGHSDADVGWHALSDAILGAAALGDIGDHFPPSDPKWKGADSAIILETCQSLALEAGYGLTSCDITLICEAPKIKPHREEMRARTAAVTGLPLDAISIKATTTEGLGFAGRKEGIAAQASAVLMPVKA